MCTSIVIALAAAAGASASFDIGQICSDVDVSGWGRTVSGLVGDLDSGLVRAPGLGDLDDPVRFVESPDKAAELVGGAPGRS